MDPGLFIFFAVLFVAISLIGFIVLNSAGDVETKKTFYLWYMVIMAVLSLVYLCTFLTMQEGGESLWMLVIIVPIMVGSFLFNYHRTHFCPKCGRPTYQRTSFFMPTYQNCPYCGAPFRD